MRRADNNICDAGATTIGDALKANGSLSSLVVSSELRGAGLVVHVNVTVYACTRACDARRADNQIGSAGAAAVCNALKVNIAITMLNLSSLLRGARALTVCGCVY